MLEHIKVKIMVAVPIFSEKVDEINMIRSSVNKSMPYGKEKWVEKMVLKHHLESTLKSPGRPKKGK